MTGLVQRAQEAGEQVIGRKAGSDADVARHPFGEGLLALIEAAAVEREADRLHHFDGERPLLARGELAAERQQHAALLRDDGLADKRRQPTRKSLEHRIDVRGSDPRGEGIHQRIVGGEIERLPEERRLVAHQMHHLLEVRREQLELPLGTCLEPVRLGAGGGLGQAGNQADRRRDGMVALPAHLPKIRDLPVGESLGVGLRPIEQPRDARRSEQRVVLGLERGKLLAANVGTAPRHHHRRIPAQQRQRSTEGVEALELLLELFVRRGGHGPSEAAQGR